MHSPGTIYLFHPFENPLLNRTHCFPLVATQTSTHPFPNIADFDSEHLARAVALSVSSAGLTAPHPNAGCVVAHGSEVVGEGYLYAQGTESAEAKAVRAAGSRASGATAYMNLEPGDCHGDEKAVRALIDVSSFTDG
jgi:hypothetical protein